MKKVSREQILALILTLTFMVSMALVFTVSSSAENGKNQYTCHQTSLYT